jgi:hypothetical protein
LRRHEADRRPSHPQQAHAIWSSLWASYIRPTLTAGQRLVVEVKPERKSRDQEKKYHSMLADLSEQWELHGRKWDEESMKRLCVDQFRRDTAKDPDLGPLWEDMGTVEMAPSIDGGGIVALGWQTRRFPKKLASAFVEWLYALGAEVNVTWSDPT